MCCCDIILVRYNPETKRKECLLVERASEPVKGVWWWPGGRILKGETFFDAASRKQRKQTKKREFKMLSLFKSLVFGIPSS